MLRLVAISGLWIGSFAPAEGPSEAADADESAPDESGSEAAPDEGEASAEAPADGEPADGEATDADPKAAGEDEAAGTDAEGETALPDVAPDPKPVEQAPPEPAPAADPVASVPFDAGALGEEDEDFDPRLHSPESIRARKWRTSGVVATSGGVLLGAAAIAFATSAPCAPKAGNGCFKDARLRAALASGLPGAALLVGGVTMLTVGSVRLSRLRVEFSASENHAHFGLRGRF